MSSDGSHAHGSTVRAEVGRLVGVFGLAGAGIGLTGGVSIVGMGSGGGILSGVLVLVVLTVAFLLGPIVGILGGLQTGRRLGRSAEAYLAGVVGAVGGYVVMMALVLAVLAASLSLAVDGGTTAASQSGAASGSAASGGQLPIGEYLLPILAVAIPTALTGAGGVFLGADGRASRREASFDVPWRYVAGGVVVLFAVVVGAAVLPGLLAPDPTLEISGSAATSGDSLYAVGDVTNPSDEEVTSDLTIDLVVEDRVAATREVSVTLAAGESRQLSWRVVRAEELSERQVDAVANGNFELEFALRGRTVETYRP